MKGSELSMYVVIVIVVSSLTLFSVSLMFFRLSPLDRLSVFCELKNGYCLQEENCGDYVPTTDESCSNHVCCIPHTESSNTVIETLDLGGGITGIRIRVG
jgi:hypothetical protein